MAPAILAFFIYKHLFQYLNQKQTTTLPRCVLICQITLKTRNNEKADSINRGGSSAAIRIV